MDFKSYIGIPYTNKGRSTDGCDCWGLIRLFYKNELGIELPLVDHYNNVCDNSDVAESVAIEKPRFEEIDYDDRQMFDIIMFRICKLPVHTGLMLDNGRMLHTLAGHNSAIERYDSASWNRRIDGVFRWKT